MLQASIVRRLGLSLPRASAPLVSSTPRSSLARSARFLSSSPTRRNKNDPYHISSTAAPHGTSAGDHEGAASRTDKGIKIEYPADHEMPSEIPVQGRGGYHLKRTLPTFSLEGRVAVITGGARGLGLVMGQAIIESGGDLAIVDLNSRPGQKYTSFLPLTVW